MNTGFTEAIRSAFRRGGARFRNQLSVFIVCMAVSVFLWILVKLSREYYYSVEYHLKYTHVPSGYRLVAAADSILYLKIRIQGYDYFTERLFMGKESTYEISLRSLHLRPSENGARGYLLTNSIGYDIASQSGYTHSYVTTSPDTLFFDLERRSAKKAH